MKKIISLLLFFGCLNLSAQKIQSYDRIIDMKYYTACYSDSIQTSSYVVYRVYRPSYKASRGNLSFRPYFDLPHYNYTKSGYDIGHLVSAYSYSDSPAKVYSTFVYINAVPQTPRLNRGIWKKDENLERKMAYSDSILVVAGGCNYSPSDSIVPPACFKIIYSLTTHKPLLYKLYSNSKNPKSQTCNHLVELIPFEEAWSLYYNKRSNRDK